MVQNKTREKKLTRAKAEHQLSHGANAGDTIYTSHANYHVRRRAWYLMGGQLPEGAEERSKLLANLHLKEKETAPEMAPDHPVGEGS